MDDARFLGQLSPEILAKPLHLFELRDTKPKWKLAYNGLWTHKMFRAPNPPAGITIDYLISEYSGDEVSITIENENGVKVKSLSGSNAPGFNRVVWNLQPDEWHKLPDKGEEMFMNDFTARPGKYTIKVKMGDHSVSGSFQILER